MAAGRPKINSGEPTTHYYIYTKDHDDLKRYNAETGFAKDSQAEQFRNVLGAVNRLRSESYSAGFGMFEALVGTEQEAMRADYAEYKIACMLARRLGVGPLGAGIRRSRSFRRINEYFKEWAEYAESKGGSENDKRLIADLREKVSRNAASIPADN